jgi:UDP-N-acetylmuramate dehydrogenase
MIIPSTIQQNISLSDKNWFKTGGAARFFMAPNNADEFQEGIQFCITYGVPLYLLGSGANILIADEGFEGLVIQPHLNGIESEHVTDDIVHLKAGAGVTIDQLITWCLEHELVGLEEFSGIPGTVGGAVYINLHYFEFLLHQFLFSARVIEAETGKIQEVTNDWFQFAYDYSRLHERTHFLVDATFVVRKKDAFTAAFAKGRAFEIMRHRARRYPQKNTCGSFFRNFHEHEVTQMTEGKKMIYVAYYLDQLSVKGSLKVGGAVVSRQHANMIINEGNATSSDIITLARTMQEMVKEKFGIVPQAECQLVGFKEYPLL